MCNSKFKSRKFTHQVIKRWIDLVLHTAPRLRQQDIELEVKWLEIGWKKLKKKKKKAPLVFRHFYRCKSERLSPVLMHFYSKCVSFAGIVTVFLRTNITSRLAIANSLALPHSKHWPPAHSFPSCWLWKKRRKDLGFRNQEATCSHPLLRAEDQRLGVEQD